MRGTNLPVSFGLVIALCGIGAAGSAEQSPARSAAAEIKSPDGKTIGRAELTGTPNGVLVHLKLTAAPSGAHALHVHETGRCDAPTFESAGGHYNPTNAEHGFEDAKGPHVGDLPNVHVGSGGVSEAEFLLDDASIGGGKADLLDADGSALVLHAGPDDYSSEPAGDAGKRVGCGVITAQR